MSGLRAPRYEIRRRAELRAELFARAKAWLPEWHPSDSNSDFAGALLEIAARLESEVTQRLDKMPEKMFRGFLEWLGVRGSAAQAARLPLVFALTPKSEPVLAPAPVLIQATPPPSPAGAAEPVKFETEQDLMIVPGSLASLYAVDPAGDAYYAAPDGFSPSGAPAPGPSSWTVTADAKVNATQIQLTPALGLDALPLLLHEKSQQLYRVTKANDGLVTIDPPVGTMDRSATQAAAAPQAFSVNDVLSLRTLFDPFGTARRNLQQHAVYIGSESLLNLPADAQIGIDGLGASNITWSYWGKAGTGAVVDWQPLTPVPGTPILTLQKNPGSVESRMIGDKPSRWLRGLVPPGTPGMTVSHIGVTVNSAGCGPDFPPCPPGQGGQSKVQVEGIANTTPLVLDAPFYPLGREPRLFDAFYLGSPEAFSKSNASVRICLEALDGTAISYTAANATTASNTVFLYGVGSDGFLHRMKEQASPSDPVKRLEAVRPPMNEAGKPTVNTPPVSLDKSQARLSALSRAGDLLVAAMADNQVWIWSENLAASPSGKWYFLGAAGPPSTHNTAAILMADAPNLHAVVLNKGVLYEASLAPGWEQGRPVQWTPVPGTNLTVWARIAPVFRHDAPRTGARFADGWVAIGANGDFVLFGKNDAASKKVKNLPAADPRTIPLAVQLSAVTGEILLAAATAANRLDAWTYDSVAGVTPLANVTAAVAGDSFDWAAGSPDGLAIVFTTSASGAGNLAAWFPMAPGTGMADKSALYQSKPATGLTGSPAIAALNAFTPGANASIVSMPFDPAKLQKADVKRIDLATALVVENAPDHPLKKDFLEAKFHAGQVFTSRLTADAAQNGSRYWLRIPRSAGKVVDSVTVYRDVTGTVFNGRVDAATGTILTPDALDNPQDGSILTARLATGLRRSIHTVSVTGGVVTLTPPVPGVMAGTTNVVYEYVAKVQIGTPQLLPKIRNITPATAAALLQSGAYFNGAQPVPDPVLFLDPTGAPSVAILAQAWTTAPLAPASGQPYKLIMNGIFGDVFTVADNKSANPALSWEYFDGQAWWTIPGLEDGTLNLRSTGVVTFCAPAGLQPTDVAGRKSAWIRARLVGGDYGQEVVTVHTAPDPAVAGGSIQTVDRSLSGISPPLLGSVNITYSLCCASNPDYVLTLDGGNTVDQTAANLLDAAKVELFQSLQASISRAASGAPDAGAADPAIFLGFDVQFSGGPITLLFLAEDGDFDDAYPLRADVLRQSGFEPLVPEDRTRGLSESGVLSFYLPEEPPLTTLFGAGPRCWIRLRPSTRLKPAANWRPKIRQAFLNAVFAHAAETQDMERLGSSDGSPGQQVLLARHPVVAGSLDLRIQEPLLDEEIQALLSADPNSVLNPLPNGQTGNWVAWKPIAALEEAGKDDRNYEFDSDAGAIKFGDGKHGRIPPVGANSIVAVTYKQGGAAAGNQIKAWSSINLITPVIGAGATFAPDDAAGGSDPQTPDEVVRFAPANQFMRDRALTYRDFEILAVESSRDIVQARALANGAKIRLVAVARGVDPVPTRAQRRELLRFLTARTSPALVNALTVEAPRLLEIRTSLNLALASIELSGAVSLQANQRIQALLDPATGGLDGLGWPLGELPSETDIAAALDDVPHLESIEAVTIHATVDGVAITAALPGDLAVLAPTGVNIGFVVASEVGA